MPIQIQETFRTAAPVETVWRFLLDPHRVVRCMPGAELQQVVDDRTFDGTVRVKLGAITTRYRGRVRITEVDDRAHRVNMLAEGRETGGGTARGVLTGELRGLPDGGTEVVASAEIDLTGRVMQLGRGMIQGVSSQLFGQFVDRTRQTLEASGSEGRVPAPAREDSIPLLRMILRVVFAPVARFFSRRFGSPAA